MRPIFLSGLVLLLSLGFQVGCRDKDHDHDHGGQEKVALKLPTGTPHTPQGLAALTVKAGPQPFTKTDVTNYFKTHNLPMNSGPLSQIKVDTLEFVTSKEVTTRLQGVSTGLADEDRIGYATLTGTFIFSGPPKSKPATFTRAYAAFDAKNGNLLMVGTLGESEKPR
ncbi:MAG: hypothetical protein WB780_06650 [Candidatus Acidiferrales bacterium]